VRSPLSRVGSAALILAALAAGASGCSSTNACKQGTILVTVTFDSATAAATSLLVQVTETGAAVRQQTLAHQPGTTSGTIEVDFPAGYTAGQQVTVAITASNATGPLGTASGTALLMSGCSTLAIRFGNADGGAAGAGGGGTGVAGGGGAGGKGPGGAGGSNAGGAAGGLAGAGGLGVAGSSGNGGAAGGGGAGTGGAGGAACVFKSAEDCFNGIDDDCNGKTDCEDPACTAGTECIAAPGSTFQAGTEVATPTTTCPSNFTGGETALNEGLSVPAATSCSGCSCSATTSCSISLYSYSTAATCSADTAMTGGTLVGTITNSAMCNTPSAGFTGAGYRVGPITQSDSACTPSGTPTLPATSWTTQKKFCAANRVGGGCSPGYVCAPKLTQVSDHCVRADGANLSCPAGYSPQTDAWYKSASDTRACAACGCGTETAGDCTKESLSGTAYARSLAFWPNSFGMCSQSGGTSFNVSTTPNSKTCCALMCEASSCAGTGGIACGNFGYAYPPLQASCPATSAISGAAGPTGPETVCCI
jgi:hypothetical protein